MSATTRTADTGFRLRDWLPTLTLHPGLAIRLRVTLLSAVVSPVAITLLALSLTTITGRAVTGQPMASPVAVVGVFAAGLVMAAVGAATARSSASLWTFAATAAVVAVADHVLSAGAWARAIGESSTPGAVDSVDVTFLTLVGPLRWTALPVLLFVASASAAGASFFLRRRLARAPRRAATNAADPSERRAARRSAPALLLSSALIWVGATGAAPSDPTPVARFGFVALGNVPVQWPAILAVCLGLALFALAASRSLAAGVAAAGGALALPGLLLIPVAATLGGSVATPGAPLATSLALAAPLVGALGVALIALTWATAWLRD